ncbi:MAG: DUF104 domain-containing protein [Planctomycetes bacterium]|nr:DUF104 domain-containing protein [Planctomycetota bacterium]
MRYNDNTSRLIPAIFNAGVFRPLEPVDLAEGTQVEVRVPTAAPSESVGELSPDELARQRSAIEKMLAEIESLPVLETDDGFRQFGTETVVP